MAVVLGTNSGFVSTAPSADPAGTNYALDTSVQAVKHTAPAGASSITEIGWWCDNATQESNFEVGVYSDNSGFPDAKVGSFSQTNAKGTTSGWKRVTGLNIPITAGNVYWIAVQLDDTLTTTNINYSATTGSDYEKKPVTTLPDPLTGGSRYTNESTAIYAVYSGAPRFQINIGDSWKTVAGVQINIGDTWKAVPSAQINIGDAWKTI